MRWARARELLPAKKKWRTEDPTGRGANGPTRGSSPKLRRRTFPLSFWVPLREHPEDPVLVPRNFAREGLYSYTSLSGAHPHSDEAAVDTDEGLVLVDSEGAAVASEYRASTDRGALPGSESATALGTAFHRLAQQAIELSERGALFCPARRPSRPKFRKRAFRPVSRNGCTGR